jgi:hypothetical protein
VEGFSGVLFNMDPLNAYAFFAGSRFNIHMTMLTKGHVILGNLERLDQVRIEIVLAVHLALFRYFGVESESGLDCELNSPLVDDRQCAGKAKTDRAAVRIDVTAVGRRAAAEHLGGRREFRVDLETDQGFKFHL